MGLTKRATDLISSFGEYHHATAKVAVVNWHKIQNKSRVQVFITTALIGDTEISKQIWRPTSYLQSVEFEELVEFGTTKCKSVQWS